MISERQLERTRREVGGFAGLIGMWGVISEAAIMPVWTRSWKASGASMNFMAKGSEQALRWMKKAPAGKFPWRTLEITNCLGIIWGMHGRGGTPSIEIVSAGFASRTGVCAASIPYTFVKIGTILTDFIRPCAPWNSRFLP